MKQSPWMVLVLFLILQSVWISFEGCHNGASPTIPPILTSTPTKTLTPTPTFTLTLTITNSRTNTPTATPTPTTTNTNTPWPTNVPTSTFTITSTDTDTPTITETPTNTNTQIYTPTVTLTNTPTNTFTSVAPANCTSTSTPALIDDFEANTSSNTSILQDQCRTGYYFWYGNPSPSVVVASPGTGFACTSGTSANALHYTSGPVTGYGSVFAIASISGGEPYDISSFTGIHFCGMLGSTAAAIGPGTLEIDDASGGNSKSTIPTFTTSWQQIQIAFPLTGANLHQVTTILWTDGTTTSPVDYWLDNISFY